MAAVEFTRAELTRAADEASWRRGEDYFERGRVRSAVEHGGKIHATVRGAEDYAVTLWTDDGGISGDCSCPMGDGGVFCKHCVAAGLSWLALQKEGRDGESRDAGTPQPRPAPRKAGTPAPAEDDVRRFLLSLEQSTLVDFVVEQAAQNEALSEELAFRTAIHSGREAAVAVMRAAIDSATRSRGFIEYRKARECCRRIRAAIEPIAEVLRAGYAADAVDLAERALSRCERLMRNMDTSDGDMGFIMSCLAKIHHEACLAARPDPVKFARRIFAWEMRTEWDTFYGAAEQYADVLTETGLAEYARLVRKEWDSLPALGPGQDGDSYAGNRFRITSIMESLVRAGGDVDALIEVKKRDLSTPYNYLQIALVCEEAARDDDALAWAEKGLADFSRNRDDRLIEFVADQYHDRGRRGKAMALMWDLFARAPSAHEYERLRKHAERAGELPKWCEKAISYVRHLAEKERAAPRTQRAGRWRSASDNSTLVEILLLEDMEDQAWAAATAGGCEERLWLILAERRGPSHPDDAVYAYRLIVDKVVPRGNNSAYDEAAGYVGKVCGLLAKVGRPGDARAYLADLRARFKPKRNFMARLDAMEARALR